MRSRIAASRVGARYRRRPRRSSRRATRQVLVAGIEAHAHRDALHDLHPVAAGVLRWQLARGLVPLGYGIAIARVLFGRNIGVAVEVGDDRSELLIERGELLLCVLQIPARRIEGLL
jgi:hypothetical protein